MSQLVVEHKYITQHMPPPPSRTSHTDSNLQTVHFQNKLPNLTADSASWRVDYIGFLC